MGRRATALTMSDFPVTFTLTVMRGRPTTLINQDFPVAFTLTSCLMMKDPAYSSSLT
jgi:hypothetical protein